MQGNGYSLKNSLELGFWAAIHKQKVYGFSSRIPQGLASGAAIFMQK